MLVLFWPMNEKYFNKLYFHSVLSDKTFGCSWFDCYTDCRSVWRMYLHNDLDFAFHTHLLCSVIVIIVYLSDTQLDIGLWRYYYYFTLFFHSRVKIILSTENWISLSLFLSHTYLYIYIYQQCYLWNLHIDLIVMLFVWLFVGSQRVWKPTVQKADKKKLCSYLHCWITCALLTTLIFHFGSYCYNQCSVIVAPLEGWYGKSHWPFCTFWHKKMTRRSGKATVSYVHDV